MFFESWSGLVRVAVIGTAAYVALIVVLRVSGKRTLTKFNAFDLVVTVALGSTLATVLLSKSVVLAEGLAALALLVVLQLAITWLSVRSARFGDWVKSEPTFLLRGGRFSDRALERERVTREEVMAALRGAGAPDCSSVAAVVLETDGSLSVIREPAATSTGGSTLANVRDLG
jgi:uncharacterized membrane protein YcaP (DUF421 family)